MKQNRMYADLAKWWPLLSPPEDYEEEGAAFLELFADAGAVAGGSCLELGCGGGHTASHLKAHFSSMTLTDLAPEMLAVSRELNPECEHVQGDMRDLRLGKTFDCVFVHDAIEYMTTLADLRRALETAWEHLKPGGVALFVPDAVRDHFETRTEHGGNDDGNRSMRYLEWIYDPDETDSTCVADYVFVLRDGDQPVQVVHEQHIYGNFYEREWLDTLEGVGLEARSFTDSWERMVFVTTRPAN